MIQFGTGICAAIGQVEQIIRFGTVIYVAIEQVGHVIQFGTVLYAVAEQIGTYYTIWGDNCALFGLEGHISLFWDIDYATMKNNLRIRYDLANEFS